MSKTKYFNKKRREIFLETIREGKTIGAACEAAEITRYIAAKVKKDDPDFALEWQDAKERGTERLEDELYQRALKADTGPAITAALYLMKNRNPEKYGDAKSDKSSNQQEGARYDAGAKETLYHKLFS